MGKTSNCSYNTAIGSRAMYYAVDDCEDVKEREDALNAAGGIDEGGHKNGIYQELDIG